MLANGYHEVPAGKIAAVVTTLEMVGRAAACPEPSGTGWQLQRHERADPMWYRELYHRIGAPWLWFSRLRMSVDELRAVIHDPDVQVYSLVHEGRDEGLLELDFRSPGVCELAFFGISSALLGTGAGRWLMNRATEAAYARPIAKLWVHTCTLDHPAALAFYRKAGFIPVSRQVEVADDPRRDGELAPTDAPQVPML